MTKTIEAVYENGVLRPKEPLALAEGETIDLTITRRHVPGFTMRPPTPEEEDYARRLKATRTVAEMHEVMKTAPVSPEEEDYDICEALNANRRANGERLLFPELDNGSNS